MNVARNLDVRLIIASKGVLHKELAQKLGITKTTFSHWLCDKELDVKRKQRIYDALAEI